MGTPRARPPHLGAAGGRGGARAGAVTDARAAALIDELGLVDAHLRERLVARLGRAGAARGGHFRHRLDRLIVGALRGALRGDLLGALGTLGTRRGLHRRQTTPGGVLLRPHRRGALARPARGLLARVAGLVELDVATGEAEEHVVEARLPPRQVQRFDAGAVAAWRREGTI